jgi:hypothetical protein
MRASEWQFLCAVHESPKSCCAIDYCCHTLDWATNIVTSQKIFPSRLSLSAGDAHDDRGAGVKHLVSIFRRLHRIFAHAWYQHREVFWRVEGQTGLYVLFKTVCDTYDLLPADNYKLPPEAEGLEPVEEVKAPAPSILKPDTPPTQSTEEFLQVGRTNTRRHIRQSPSVGSAVTTVIEADEEESANVTRKLDELSIGDEEEEGQSEIPVIVESYDAQAPQEAKASAKEEEPSESEQPDLQSSPQDDTEVVSGAVPSKSVDESKPEAAEDGEAKAETETEPQVEAEEVAPTETKEEKDEAPVQKNGESEVSEDAKADKGAEPDDKPELEPEKEKEKTDG